MLNTKQFTSWSLNIEDGVAHVSILCEKTSENTFAFETMDGLDKLLDYLSTIDHKCVVFRSARKNFIVGADINEISLVRTANDVYKLINSGWDVMEKLAAHNKPTVAIVEGICFGGGYEMCLACDYIIASQAANFALPEVNIGILPGWGGMKRLPVRIGMRSALDLMLTGRSYNARKANKLGMIDLVLPKRSIDLAAKTVAYNIASLIEKKKKLSLLDRILPNSFVCCMAKRALTAKEVLKDNYPSPFAIIESCKLGGNILTIDDSNSISAVNIFKHKTTAGLLRVYALNKKLKAIAKAYKGNKASSVHIVGAGLMGCDIASWCLLKGLKISLQDLSQAALANSYKKIFKYISKKCPDKHDLIRIMDRLSLDIKGDGVYKADVIIEAVIEDISIKHKIIKEIERKAKPDALIATNTSSIVLEDIYKCMEQPNRLVGVHFFNPATIMPLVEVVRARDTSEEMFNKALGFVGQISKLPLPCKSAPGFLVNKVLVPYILNSLYLVDQGYDKYAIDAAVKAFGMPMGPVELADVVGLDVCMIVGRSVQDSVDMEPPRKLLELVAAGKLGRKSGEGYYKHANNKIVDKKKSDPISSDIIDKLVAPLYETTEKLVRDGVVANEDLADAGMIFGAGFAPFRGGPIYDRKTRV